MFLRSRRGATACGPVARAPATGTPTTDGRADYRRQRSSGWTTAAAPAGALRRCPRERGGEGGARASAVRPRARPRRDRRGRRRRRSPPTRGPAAPSRPVPGSRWSPPWCSPAGWCSFTREVPALGTAARGRGRPARPARDLRARRRAQPRSMSSTAMAWPTWRRTRLDLQMVAAHVFVTAAHRPPVVGRSARGVVRRLAPRSAPALPVTTRLRPRPVDVRLGASLVHLLVPPGRGPPLAVLPT